MELKKVNQNAEGLMEGNEKDSNAENIIWTSSKKEQDNPEVKDNKIEEKDTKTPENEINIPMDEIEEKPEGSENEPENDTNDKEDKKEEEKETEASNKKRNVHKFGDKDWASKLSEDQKIKPDTIFYLGTHKKFGVFKDYAKKEGLYQISMFKKNSLETMSRPWPVVKELLEAVEVEGKIVNDKFVKTEDKGYQLAENVKDAK